MSMLKELGISEIGDNLRGHTSSTKMHYNKFKISCGNPEADQMITRTNEQKYILIIQKIKMKKIKIH